MIRQGLLGFRPRLDLARLASAESTAATIANARARGHPVSDDEAHRLHRLAERRRQLIADVNRARQERRALAARRAADEARRLKQTLSTLEQHLRVVEDELFEQVIALPNDTHREVVCGDEAASPVVRRRSGGAATPRKGTDHLEIGRRFNWFDFKTPAMHTGANFVTLRREAALLETALVSWSMAAAVAHGYEPLQPPDLVRTAFSELCGFKPKTGEHSQTFYVTSNEAVVGTSHDDGAAPMHCLAGTSEIPLMSAYANEIIDFNRLPIRLVAVSHCFRAEAGGSGHRHRGLYRLHQFTKVELGIVCAGEDSERMHEELLQVQEELWTALDVDYRVRDMASTELGAAAHRKFDLEAWMPSHEDYCEVTSTSNCTDYQARRLNIRTRRQGGEATEFVHTLNGTALAVPRAMLALVENHYDETTQRVLVPESLQPFLFGHKSMPFLL